MVDFKERLHRLKSDDFQSLRTSQQRVLKEYTKNHLDTSDLAIEMPTGEGKTLVALLIADYALDQGQAVAYLTGTRQLADHAAREAKRLRLDAVQFAGGQYGNEALLKYHEAESVGIMNYWVYFNADPTPQPADLIIFDDAHLAEQPLADMDTLRVSSILIDTAGLYKEICDIILTHTKAYEGLRSMRDGNADPATPPELISFQHWIDANQSVYDCVHASDFISYGDGRFVWQRVRNKLDRCCLVISASGLEIRPYHPLTTLNKWYSDASQRLYMSATLGQMEDLQRRLGSNTIHKLNYSPPSSESMTGRRLLILRHSEKESGEVPVPEWTLKQIECAGGRAAWLCSSNAEADLIQEWLEDKNFPVFRLQAGNEEIIQDWHKAVDGSLVTAGRYDGLDLIGDVCRLVIIPTIPHSNSELERFVTRYLGDASFTYHRIGQRITQAIGRANRAPDDYAMYLGLDPRFGKRLSYPDVMDSIPSDSRSVVVSALKLLDSGMDEIDRICSEFWSSKGKRLEDTRGLTTLKKRPGRRRQKSSETSTAMDEIQAVTELWIGDYSRAAAAAQRVADELSQAGQVEHSGFWRYVEAHAHYCRNRKKDVSKAADVLRSATQDAPRTSWFARLARMADELSNSSSGINRLDSLFRAWDQELRDSGSVHQLYQRMSRERSHLLGTHDQRCDALVALGRLSGVSGRRPDRREQAAPDCLWWWYSKHREERRVWEVKTGSPEVVKRTEVNQLLGQIEVESKRSGEARVRGCLVSPAREVKGDAAEAAQDRIVIIHYDALVKLWDILADRFRRYSEAWDEGDAESRGEARITVEEFLPKSGFLGRLLKPSMGRMLFAEDIEDMFPSV